MRMCKSYVVVGGWLDNQHITVNNNGMLKGPCHKMFGKLFPLTLSDVSMFMLNRLSNYFKYVFFLRDNQQERCKVHTLRILGINILCGQNSFIDIHTVCTMHFLIF